MHVTVCVCVYTHASVVSANLKLQHRGCLTSLYIKGHREFCIFLLEIHFIHMHSFQQLLSYL